MDEAEDLPQARRARLKAQRRSRKSDPGRMRRTGTGVFLLQRLMAERAERARRQLGQRARKRK
jgi:hypothetical protein